MLGEAPPPYPPLLPTSPCSVCYLINGFAALPKVVVDSWPPLDLSSSARRSATRVRGTSRCEAQFQADDVRGAPHGVPAVRVRPRPVKSNRIIKKSRFHILIYGLVYMRCKIFLFFPAMLCRCHDVPCYRKQYWDPL